MTPLKQKQLQDNLKTVVRKVHDNSESFIECYLSNYKDVEIQSVFLVGYKSLIKFEFAYMDDWSNDEFLIDTTELIEWASAQ